LHHAPKVRGLFYIFINRNLFFLDFYQQENSLPVSRVLLRVTFLLLRMMGFCFKSLFICFFWFWLSSCFFCVFERFL